MMFVTALAAAVATVPMPPTGKWIVNFDTELCVASRDYGSVDKPVTLAFRPFPTQPAMDVVVLDYAPASRFMQEGKGAIVLQPGGERIEVEWNSFGVGDGRRITHVEVGRTVRARMAGATTLSLDLGKRRIDVAIPAMKAALSALSTCETDLLHGWGVDPSMFKDGVEPPRALGRGPASWVSADQYPAEAFRAHVQGRVVALMQIDATGKVDKCRVVDSARNDALDQATCSVLLTRARYAPSHDAAGKAIASWSLMPVRWVLP